MCRFPVLSSFLVPSRIIKEKLTVSCLTGRFLGLAFQSTNCLYPCVCEVSGLLHSPQKEAAETKITFFQLDAFKTSLSVFIKNAK